MCVFCACCAHRCSEKFSVSTAWCYVCFVPAVPVVSLRGSLCLQPDVMCVLCLQYQLFQWEVLCVYSLMLCVFCACSTSCFSERFSVSTVWHLMCVFCVLCLQYQCLVESCSEKFSTSTAWRVCVLCLQYQYLVESCSEKFSSPGDRRQHLIKTHHYPANFRFHRLRCAGDQQRWVWCVWSVTTLCYAGDKQIFHEKKKNHEK